MNRDLAMYVLVNQDVEINKGKLAGQVGHAVAVYFWKYGVENALLIKEYMANIQKKIILYAPQPMLEELEKSVTMGLPSYITIRDKGFTDLEPNTLTCVSVGILDKNDIPKELNFIKNLKLCR